MDPSTEKATIVGWWDMGIGRSVPIPTTDVFTDTAIPNPDRKAIIKEAKELSAKLIAEYEEKEAKHSKPEPTGDGPETENP